MFKNLLLWKVYNIVQYKRSWDMQPFISINVSLLCFYSILKLFHQCGILKLFHQCGILKLFHQCGILKLFHQCVFWSCSISVVFWSCSVVFRSCSFYNFNLFYIYIPFAQMFLILLDLCLHTLNLDLRSFAFFFSCSSFRYQK